jgi:hypothetical protein
MRTTLTLDDPLAKELKKLAAETGEPFKNVVNETLRAGLLRRNSPPRRAYRLTPVAMGVPRRDVDLNKALQLAEQLEDTAIKAKLEQRK